MQWQLRKNLNPQRKRKRNQKIKKKLLGHLAEKEKRNVKSEEE